MIVGTSPQNESQAFKATLSYSGVGVVCFNVRLGALKSHTPDSETINFIKAVKTVMDVSHQEFMKFPFYRWFNTPMFNRMSKAQEVIRE